MNALIDSLARRTDLTALRALVAQQQERADIIRARDYANNRAAVAKIGLEIPAAAEAGLRQEASRLTARLGKLPHGKRSLRRAAERALRRAEKRAKSAAV